MSWRRRWAVPQGLPGLNSEIRGIQRTQAGLTTRHAQLETRRPPQMIKLQASIARLYEHYRPKVKPVCSGEPKQRPGNPDIYGIIFYGIILLRK
jgi:hypothetical protein